MKEYCIPYKGLKNGEYEFTFSIDSQFFKDFESSIIEKGEFEIHLNFDKKESLIVLDFNINGFFSASCDRCLNLLQIPLGVNEQIIVKIDEDERWENDVMFIDPDTHQIDISDVIYEIIHVNMPLMNVVDCENDGFQNCNQEILKKLKTNSKGDVETEPVIWKKLKKLKFK